jgi:hypothetical protein
MRLLEEEIFKIKSMMNIPTLKNVILESNAIFGGTEVDVNNFEVGGYYYTFHDLYYIMKILEIKGDNLTYLEMAFDKDAVKYDKDPVKNNDYPKWIVVGASSSESPPIDKYWQTSEKFWNYVLTFTYVDDYSKDVKCKNCVPIKNIKVGRYYIYKKDAYDEIVKIKTIDGDKITVDYIEYNVLTRNDDPDEYIYDIESFNNRWDLSDEKTWKQVMSLPISDDVKKGSDFNVESKKEKKNKKEEKRKNNKEIENKKDNSDGCSYDKTKGIDLGDVTEIPMNGIAKFTGEIDGKEVTINGCFSNGKVILTYDEGETGSRGDFKGNYYTTDTSQPFSFSGDPQFSNKFLYGTLNNNNEIDIQEYKNNFHTSTWKYTGYFTKEGKIGESQPTIKLNVSKTDNNDGKPTISFPNNTYYVGEFKDSRINGKGVFYFGDSGLNLEGTFYTVDNGEGGITYSAKLKSGKDVENIFEYEKKYVLNKNQNNDQKLGVLKKGELNGKTFFNTKIRNRRTKEEKELKGFLPFTNVTLVNNQYRDITFTTKSDEEGIYSIDNLPFGTYEVSANYVQSNGKVIFKIPSKKTLFVFDDPSKPLNISLIPTKEKQRIDNEMASTSFRDFFEKISSENYVETTLKTEDAGYDKFLKKSTESIEEYNDKETLNFCKTEITKYAKMVRDLYQGKIAKNMVKSGVELQPTKTFLKKCYMKYKDESNFFNYRKNKDLVLIMNPGGDLYDFKVVLENKDIYYKNNNMSISNSIRKVLSEQTQKNQDLVVERKIIKNRLGFVFETSNRRELSKNLYKESASLIHKGYDEKTIRQVLQMLLK